MTEIALVKKEDSSSCLIALIMSTANNSDLLNATYEDAVIVAVTSESEEDIKKLKYLKVLSILAELEKSNHRDKA